MSLRVACVLALLLPGATSMASAASAPAPARSVPAGTPRSAAPGIAPPADSATVMALLAGVTNRACPLPGIATGGQPGAEHFRSLAKAGYRTVLDMRGPDEPRGFDEEAAIKAAGLEYVLLPVTSPASLTDELFAAFRKTMNARAATGVFVHCSSGNRIGGPLVAWLVLDRGWELERAVASAKANGLRTPELEVRARDYVARMRKAK